jgi:Ca2+-transporting ATPase
VALIFALPPLTDFFGFETLGALSLLACIATGFVSVAWFELVKLLKRWRLPATGDARVVG